ncbi:neuroblastoma-amplified sequence [Trichonephila clavata]|uniref:Neuroblastoma-amplified sequence n=1 Tax=Trichonephila clavata TaxID=2740835 RepID=A0A8X6JGB0_TRICU|nr:neuroblastoma-amplified sequence [Trichonephila clavata]
MLQETEELENNILYELLIYAEWQQEPEVQGKGASERSDGNGNDGYFGKWLGPLLSQPYPPLVVQQLNNLQMPWAFAIGGNGAVIAILQDASLEIRTSRDEYGAIIGRTQVSKDPYPQWRRLLWSPDCTMLACAQSNGKLDFYDLIGAHMFTIDNMVSTNPQNGKQDFRFAIAGMAFSDVRVKNTQWSYEFLVANYSGEIHGFYVSPSDGFKTSHKSFSLSSCYPFGISCFVYHPVQNILIVCGKSQKLSLTSDKSAAAQTGISIWRMLSDSPYYKLTLSMDEQVAYSKVTWRTLLSQYSFYQNSNEDLVFKMSISPNGKILAAVHISGALSLWDLPSLRQLNLHPNYPDINSQLYEPRMKKKSDLNQTDKFHSHIIDINWWSDEAIIIARRCGAVTVSSTKTFQNLLGVSPEWFEPSPALTSFCDRGFLALECESRVKGKRRKVDDMDDEDEESSDDEEPSIYAHTYEMVQRVLYFITDSDRFQPPRKKIKMITKMYRLLCLKSTTPEELYTRKISNEEYGEALALAKTYNLDSDLVYQRQWRKMPATVESIHDYLSKIKKRSWVLHECMERLPESFEAAKELLHFGLQGTDLKALIAIGKGEDHGRFILSSPYDDTDDEPDTSLSFNSGSDTDDVYDIKKAKLSKKRAAMLKKVNFKKLTLEQKQLCQCRLKLLNYLDRLTTYEIILGGPILADQNYDHNFFKQFRSQCGLEAALNFASDSNWEAVATLFTYHGSETLPHRLAILNNFPETTSSIEYQSLLPLFNERELVFYSWDEHQFREPDWCETRFPKTPLSEDFIQEYYEKHKDLVKYKQFQLNFPFVTEWFLERAREIESRSGLVDNAIQLLKLGMQRNIEGLEKLYDTMITIEVLVYECRVKVDLSLKEYEDLTDFEKVKLMMSTTSQDNFLKNVHQWLVPFLGRCSKYDPGSGRTLFKSYLLSVSKNDLIYCQKVLENMKFDPSFVITDFNEIINLMLDCIYHCERTGELKKARTIYELLISLPDAFSKTYRKVFSLPGSVSNLKRHISVAELLDKNGLAVPLSLVQNISNSTEEVRKILTKLTRMASHRVPMLDEEEWKALLTDVLEMQKILFQCVTYEDCYEIILQSLLCSGKLENITFAGKMMECNNKQRKQIIGPQSFKLPYSKSVELVLAASHEYFNSSSDASDPCMSLAKSCLKLIEDVPASIEEEFDLITSISLLKEFSVTILPLQVRLSENRMSIVKEVLQKNERNYKKSHKIMKLANLLRAGNSGTREREGKVLTLIGEHAFQAKDYNECLAACQKLMEKGHEEGWLICYSLGGCNEFYNIPARYSLMSFSLAYCSEDLIETILKTRSELQLQVLQDRVKFLVGDIPLAVSAGDSENKLSELIEGDFNGMNTLWQTSEKTIQALQSTTQTAKDVISNVRNVQFWKDAINWVQPLGLGWNGKELDVDDDSNASLNKQGIFAFYDSLIENAHISKFEANYLRYARPDLHQSLEISSSILRASLIQDNLKFESAISSLESSVLLDVSKAYLPEDFVYSLCLLLTLTEVEKAEDLFTALPSSPIVLQFASLYYAIKIHVSLGLPFTDDIDTEPDPASFCKKTLHMRKTVGISSDNQNCQRYWDLLQKYDKMLYDFVQAEILHSIGGGVDATRFANDDVYKKDTILGISMTLDDNIFQTALSLAHHYSVPSWDLYMTHLEYLFSESSVSAAVITERIEKFKLSGNLLKHKKAFETRLKDYIYPGISGKDHEKLLICLSLLGDCGDYEDSLKVKPSVHKKLLSKFKASIKNIDYKKIMSPDSSISYLIEILNDSNVHMFAKVASNIPKKKYFFESSSSSPKTKTEWIHRYDSSTTILQRLDAEDVLELVDVIIFSEKALEKMSIDCRSDIVKRIIKFCRGKSSLHKSNILLSTEWSDAATALNSLYSHLQRLEDETLVQLRESFDPKIKDYCKEFDLSKSNIEKLQCLLARIVLEGPDIELLKTFISCCPSEIDWEPSDAYMKAINVICEQIKHPENSSFTCFKEITPIQALEAILDDMTKQQEELIMIEDMATEVLNEFCQDSEVAVTIRLSILQLLEKTNFISPEYCDLLLLYRTQAVVSSLWPDLQISEEEVKDEFQRKILFDSLLCQCNEVEHFSSLAKLLSHWPPFTPIESWSCYDEPWTKLLCRLVSLSNEEALSTAVSIMEKALSSPHFSFENCREVFNKIKNHNNILHTLKCALITSHEALHSEAIELLKTVEITDGNYDSELLDLILKRSSTAQIISTGLYKPVIEFLLHCQDDNELEGYKMVDRVIKELSDAGYSFEAGSLSLIKNFTHSGLSTFSSAIRILQE